MIAAGAGYAHDAAPALETPKRRQEQAPRGHRAETLRPKRAGRLVAASRRQQAALLHLLLLGEAVAGEGTGETLDLARKSRQRQ